MTLEIIEAAKRIVAAAKERDEAHPLDRVEAQREFEELLGGSLAVDVARVVLSVAALEKPEGAGQIATRIANDAKAAVEAGGKVMAWQALLSEITQALTRHAAASEARVRELEQALLKYGRHTSDCGFHYGHDCLCGIEDWRRALGGSK